MGAAVAGAGRVQIDVVEEVVQLEEVLPLLKPGRAWPLRVGGEGPGDEPELAAMIGTPPRAPLAVRFAVPVAGFAMAGVDSQAVSATGIIPNLIKLKKHFGLFTKTITVLNTT